MATLTEAVKDGMPMWRRKKWPWSIWLDINKMEILTWNKSNPKKPKIVSAGLVLTEEDVCASDWTWIPLGG